MSGSSDYYSDRVQGARPRTEEVLSAAAWGGLVALVNSRLASQFFAEDFAILCDDGPWPIGCDVGSFHLALLAEVPGVDWPLRSDQQPDTLVALDLVEFLYQHVSEPEPHRSVSHRYFGHHHLVFNRTKGRKELRDQVNRIFMRNGMTYELDANGGVQRLGTPIVVDQIRRRLPPTGDEKLDDLLERAVEKYTDPDPHVRREAAERLWDAFERAKTVLDSNKKRGAAALAAGAASSQAELNVLEEEMRSLTKIGNDFRIRHHETTKTEVTDPLVDYFFARMYALLHRLHGALSLP